AATMCGLGETLRRLRKWDEARSKLQESFALRHDALGMTDDNDDLLVGRSQLAAIELACGDFTGAEEKYRTNLAARRKLHSRDHYHISSTLANLAWTLECEQQFGEAEELFL